jgi:hypothetical protein
VWDARRVTDTTRAQRNVYITTISRNLYAVYMGIKITIADKQMNVDATTASKEEIIRFIEYMEDRKLTQEEKDWIPEVSN